MLKYIFVMGAMLSSFTGYTAVHISQNQTGEAVLFPFYTVSNGLNTYLNVHNNRNESKLVRVVLREGVDSKRVLSLNVFLSAYDSWTATLGVVDSKAVFLTNDDSCVNLIETGTIYDLLTQEVDTDPQNPLSPEALLNRVGTGWIEMYEMAVVGEDQVMLNSAILNRDCQFLDQQYETGGLWENDLSNQLSQTQGGLHGSVTLIDVLNGAMTITPAIHFEHFYPSQTIAHAAFSDEQPNLAAADTTSLLLYEGQPVSTVWATGYEAISALLINANLTSEFILDPAIAATSDWVLTLPTLRFHQQNSAAPFEFLSDGLSYRFPLPFCQRGMTFVNREGQQMFGISCDAIDPQPPLPRISKYAVNVWNMVKETVGGSLLIDDAAENYNYIGLPYGRDFDGVITFGFTDFSNPMSSSLDASNMMYHGLPVIGFAYSRLTNLAAQPGLLATYGQAIPYRGEKVITIQ